MLRAKGRGERQVAVDSRTPRQEHASLPSQQSPSSDPFPPPQDRHAEGAPKLPLPPPSAALGAQLPSQLAEVLIPPLSGRFIPLNAWLGLPPSLPPPPPPLPSGSVSAARWPPPPPPTPLLPFSTSNPMLCLAGNGFRISRRHPAPVNGKGIAALGPAPPTPCCGGATVGRCGGSPFAIADGFSQSRGGGDGGRSAAGIIFAPTNAIAAGGDAVAVAVAVVVAAAGVGVATATVGVDDVVPAVATGAGADAAAAADTAASTNGGEGVGIEGVVLTGEVVCALPIASAVSRACGIRCEPCPSPHESVAPVSPWGCISIGGGSPGLHASNLRPGGGS